MKTFLSSSKGEARNWFTVVLVLFIGGVTTFICYLVLSEFIDEMDAQGFLTGPAVGAASGFLWGLRILDYIIVLLMAIMIISVGITSYRIATKKVFFIITLILGAFYGFISYFFNYMFQQFISQDAFSSIIGYFPNTILVCTNLHWVMLITIIVGSITLYAKEEKGQFIQ